MNNSVLKGNVSHSNILNETVWAIDRVSPKNVTFKNFWLPKWLIFVNKTSELKNLSLGNLFDVSLTSWPF